MKHIVLVIFIVCGTLLARPSFGQDAEISGSIRDTSDKMISNAKVTVVNQDTAVQRSTVTDSSGLYFVAALPPGRYQMTASADGFDTQSRDSIQIETAQKVRIDFQLKVGENKQVVTVNGDQIYINQSDATVSTVIDHQFVENVPLNGRSLQSLLTLVPGVATVPGSGQVGYQGEITVDGQRTESNYFTVDGVSANSGAKIDNETGGAGYSGAVPGMTISGTTQSMVSLDDLDEFRASTSTYSADQGRTPGGQFNFTTKSGTNNWHGSLSEYFRNDDLDASNWFNGYCNAITTDCSPGNWTPFPKGAEKQNDFGGTLGGPVLIPHLYNGRDKTFFFLSYEGLRLIQPVPPSTWVVPDKAMRLAAPAVLQPFLNAYAVQNGAEMTQSPGLAYYNLVYSMPSNLDSTSVPCRSQLRRQAEDLRPLRQHAIVRLVLQRPADPRQHQGQRAVHHGGSDQPIHAHADQRAAGQLHLQRLGRKRAGQQLRRGDADQRGHRGRTGREPAPAPRLAVDLPHLLRYRRQGRVRARGQRLQPAPIQRDRFLLLDARSARAEVRHRLAQHLHLCHSQYQ